MAPDRVLIVSPVRNEVAHLERTARSLAAQTRPPGLWIAVDDGSDDGTRELLESLRAEIPFLRVMATPPAFTRGGPDRHALAASPRAFNWALRDLDLDEFSHLGKLDGDIELPHDYFERLLAKFELEPRLGVAGGTLVEPDRAGEWRPARVPSHHVRGALKLYSRECFAAIGGIEERLGWDTIDETYARMRGFSTRSFGDLVARHHRPLASANGLLRGRARYGQAAYVLRYGFAWVLLRSLKVALSRPVGVSGLAFVFGYLRAAARAEPRVEDEAFRDFVQHELRTRVSGALKRAASYPAGRSFFEKSEKRTWTGVG
jgi:biofilm PGA synthesis N-glycosyltransferase PgaC